jgi:hypothetical protein
MFLIDSIVNVIDSLQSQVMEGVREVTLTVAKTVLTANGIGIMGGGGTPGPLGLPI